MHHFDSVSLFDSRFRIDFLSGTDHLMESFQFALQLVLVVHLQSCDNLVCLERSESRLFGSA